MGTTSNVDRSPFHPYYAFKDLVTVFLFFVLFTLIVFYTPDKLGLRMANLIYKYQNFRQHNMLRSINYCSITNSCYFKLLIIKLMARLGKTILINFIVN